MISTELKSTIQGAYSRFLEAKSLKPRYGQRLMIAEVAKVLGDIDTDDEGRRSGDPAIVAVEAGTGTGKTVAYSLAAIPTAKLAGKRLVIATATVALQEQIVYKDLPDLMRNSGLNFSFALAKGRGRYMCLSKLDMLLQEGHAQTATAQLFEEEGFKIEVDEASQKLFTSMIEKLAGNKWDGDRDSWPNALEDADWARLTTDHSQCTNRHCPNFGQCAFYKAREGMGKVDVIVTNHDMVLADLALGGDLQAFQTEYQGSAVQVVIRLDARLIRGNDQKILASRRFEVRQPLAETGVPAVVTGFGQANDTLSRQVVDWAVGQGNQALKR